MVSCVALYKKQCNTRNHTLGLMERWIPPAGFHRRIPQPGFHSQDSAARGPQSRFHSQDSTAMIPQSPWPHSPDSTAMIHYHSSSAYFIRKWSPWITRQFIISPHIIIDRQHISSAYIIPCITAMFFIIISQNYIIISPYRMIISLHYIMITWPYHMGIS